MYYRLQDYCRIVEGAAKAAIYNFQTGKIYPINSEALRFLRACENQPVDVLLDTKDPASKPQLDFLDQLSAKGLGAFYVANPEPVAEKPQSAETLKLDFLWLEITSRCNNRCLHCYSTSAPDVTNDCVSHERWLELISEARIAGATAIQFIGGEPLVYPRWQELVLKAREEGYEFIEIFTNATLIDNSALALFKAHNINIATTIYADNAETHDKVTNHPGSFEKTMASVKKILKKKIPLRIASIIMRANEHEVNNIMRLCQQLGVEVTPPDVVRPTGRGDDKDLMPLSYTKQPIKPPFYTDAHSFARAKKYHSCLAGKIAITSNGDVIPCIFARNQKCGNVIFKSLQQILSDQPIQQCWHTTKDQVEKCKDCEFRYACTDCRPLAQGSDSGKRWLACSIGCSYNPYTGKWEDDKS